MDMERARGASFCAAAALHSVYKLPATSTRESKQPATARMHAHSRTEDMTNAAFVRDQLRAELASSGRTAQDAFRDIDSDKSGAIGESEFGVFVQKCAAQCGDRESRAGRGGRPMVTSEVVAGVYRVLDSDRDGEISIHEFVTWLSAKGGPAERAVSLRWLLAFHRAHQNTQHSWVAHKEHIAPEHYNYFAPAHMDADDTLSMTVTRATLAAHRESRMRAELHSNNKPVTTRYVDIPFELMLTTDVVECFVR